LEVTREIGGEDFRKNEEASGRNKRHWEKRTLEVNFFYL